MVSYIKGGMQAKGIWKQDPEANIWAQEEWEWEGEKAPQWGTNALVHPGLVTSDYSVHEVGVTI